MIRRIFRSIFFVSLLSMLLAAAAMAFMFYQTYTDKLMDTLRTQTTVIGNMVNDTGVTYLRQLDDDAYRLNLIDENGNVLYDSLQDPETMTNHSSRPEIMDAREKGWGTSVRFSRTLDEQTLYTAMKLDNGSFIRTSVTVTSFYGCMIQLVIPFALMIACISGLCFFLSRRLSHEIVQPVLDINLDDPMKSETYPQILPLLERIEAGNREISRQMEALKQKSEELEAVARNMDEGLLILAADCSILSCNEAAQKIFGIEKNGGWQIKDSSLLAEAVNTAAGTGRSVFEMESGRRRYVIETACIHHPPQPGGFVIMALDITEKYEAGRRRREFTANVTHELKTPIQSIMASAELLENNLVQPEDQPRFCGYITRESKRLLNLINDIIRLSQLDESFEDQTETLHLKAILSEIICQNEMEISRRRLTVFQNLEDVCVQGNRRMWQEVFSNLLENAVKYNREEGSIDLSLKEQEGKAVFEIRDTGIGIASKDQDRVFERFFRVDKSHSKATGGTGLGLAIVQHSVQRMNGSIEMESELNKGTLIRVLVPAGAGQ